MPSHTSNLRSSARHHGGDTRGHAGAVLAILLGVGITLCLRGYRFGESNHAVYLLAAIRQSDPSLLANDWWTNSTLQYHYAFNFLSAILLRLNLMAPAFLLGYLGLALLQHVAWYRLTLALGGTRATYLVSVVMFYVLAAGLGLGAYHFLQDSAFLPSNISNVAMLWGLYAWVRGRWAGAGAWLGVAGLYHINHALMGLGLWGALSAIECIRRGRLGSRWWIGSIVLVMLSAPAIIPAVRTVLERSGTIPLHEFVDLFVRLRHPHHFHPLSWHWSLWLMFTAPFPLAFVAARQVTRTGGTAEMARAIEMFLVIAAVTSIALIGAGVWFFSETLVQLNLYRFSIYLKLLGCIGAAMWVATNRSTQVHAAPDNSTLTRPRSRRRFIVPGIIYALILIALPIIAALGKHTPAGELLARNVLPAGLAILLSGAALACAAAPPPRRGWSAAASIAVIVLIAALWSRLGLWAGAAQSDPGDYVALARWAAQYTPRDAVFVVPPNEQTFRVHARRAIVVNFKNVPQLSAELPEWRDRLKAVLALDDLMTLPKGMSRTFAAIGDRYASLPAEHLAMVARTYGATYIVVPRPLTPPPPRHPPLLIVHESGHWILYHLPQEPPLPPESAAPEGDLR